MDVVARIRADSDSVTYDEETVSYDTVQPQSMADAVAAGLRIPERIPQVHLHDDACVGDVVFRGLSAFVNMERAACLASPPLCSWMCGSKSAVSCEMFEPRLPVVTSRLYEPSSPGTPRIPTSVRCWIDWWAKRSGALSATWTISRYDTGQSVALRIIAGMVIVSCRAVCGV